MTNILEVYTALLTELNKQESPTLLLEDFNYYFNKAIQIYINERLNIYPVGQQVVDDLSEILVLGANLGDVGYSVVGFPPSKVVPLPSNYFHLQRLNVALDVPGPAGPSCPTPNVQTIHPPTSFITSKELASITNNFYLKPSLKRVYYQVNSDNGQPQVSIFYGEQSNVEQVNVFIDYFRVPTKITLTEDALYGDEDPTPLEFKPYINQEILNRLLILIMANIEDSRIQTTKQINESIAMPQIQNTKTK